MRGRCYFLSLQIYIKRIINSHIRTVILAPEATNRRLLPLNARNEATINPVMPLIILSVELMMAGNVMTDSVTYGT